MYKVYDINPKNNQKLLIATFENEYHMEIFIKAYKNAFEGAIIKVEDDTKRRLIL